MMDLSRRDLISAAGAVGLAAALATSANAADESHEELIEPMPSHKSEHRAEDRTRYRTLYVRNVSEEVIVAYSINRGPIIVLSVPIGRTGFTCLSPYKAPLAEIACGGHHIVTLYSEENGVPAWWATPYAFDAPCVGLFPALCFRGHVA